MALPRIPTGAVTLPASVAVGVGVGGAVGGAIEPRLREIQNHAWSHFRSMPLLAVEAAALVASGEKEMDWGKAEALNTGIDGDRFEALVNVYDEAPDLATLYHLLRRKVITPDTFREGAKKGQLEDEWMPRLMQLRDIRLSPAEIANAVQQGHVPPGDILPPPVGGALPFSIPLTQIDIDPVTEAEAHGVDEARLRVLANLVGLPPGDHEMLQMWNRGIIDEESVDAGIREGHRKTKWIPALKELRHYILTPAQAAELRLRGWISPAESYRLGALSGASQETMDRLFLNRGRPATTRQVFLGHRRGGRYVGENLSERETFDRAILNSNIRPEYSDILWSQRFTYPSLFQLNRLVTSGAFTVARGKEILWNVGWEQQDIDNMGEWWAGESGGVATKLADRARSGLYTRAHSEFLTYSLSAAQATALVQRAGATAGEANTVVSLWTAERDIIETELTPAQVRQAYSKATLTLDDARARLAAAGYSPANANIFLGLEPPELTPAEIRREYARAVVTLDEAVAGLVAQGFEDANARAFLAETRPELSAKDIKDAFQDGVIDEAQARARLAALGYPDEDIDILIATWRPPPVTP